MADTTATLETPTEQSLDQQLQELFGEPAEKPSAAPDPATKPESGKPGSEASQDPATDTQEDPLEKALEDIKEDEAGEEEQTPQLTEDQQSILNAIPNVETAQRLYGVAQDYSNFTRAFESGQFDSVDQMFEAWNPGAYEAFLEHIYQKHMVKGDWTERFIAEAEGRGQDRKGFKSLENKIAQLEGKLAEKDRGSEQQRQQAENMRVADAYEKYVTGLFDQINFNKSDRKWVMSDLNMRVGADPKVMQAVRSGNLSALHGIFKAAVREYANRDKEVTEQKDTKIAQQQQKKAPVSGGVGSHTENQLPDDIKQVPKGQEDNWMMQQLGALGRKFGIKK